MMDVVPGASIAATATSHGSALRRFAQGLRWRHVFSCTVGAGMRWGLLLALPLVLLAWLWPDVLRQAVIICLAILLPTMLLAAVRAWWHSRRIFSALRQSLSGSGGEIAALHDELLTWLEVAEQTAGVAGNRASMLRWLEQDVQQRLAPHRKRALAAVTRPRLGRWRWLVPAVLLLLLIWLVALWLAPPWSGAIGGLANQPEAGNDDGQGGSGEGGEANDGEGSPPPANAANGEAQQQAEEKPAEPKPEQKEPEEKPGEQPDQQPVAPAPPPQASEIPVDPSEVPPLLELPEDQRFVVPDFIGDGPTRRARMHAAELEEQANSGSTQSGSAAQAADPETPKRPEPDFERAAEEAVRSRHVPPAERAMVRRFFDKLRLEAEKQAAPSAKDPNAKDPAAKDPNAKDQK
tara:strand:- start:645 stop:1862 length:1218 start_codon:yes stop_codon:yes gene_type:complete